MKKMMAVAVSALIVAASTSVVSAADGEALFMKKCNKCHEEGGAKAIPEDDIEVIKGMSADEINASFSDDSEAPKKMLKAWKKFSDAEKAAVIEYLSK